MHHIAYNYYLNRNHGADSYAGFSSAMIGVAGNESIETGKTVHLTERLNTLK